MRRSAIYPVLLTLLLAATTAGAQTITIDFEGYPEMTPITDQYAAAGVVFHLMGTDREPYIATTGEPGVAWVDTDPTLDYDIAVSGENSLTAGGYWDYGALFAFPVAQVSFALSDFGDCSETRQGDPMAAYLYAYDAAGLMVDSDSFTILRFEGGPDDGNVVVLSVSGSGIVRVETHGVSRDCGHAIDDFSFVPEEIGCADDDQDGVCNEDDLCPGTAITDVDAGVPDVELGRMHWADPDGDGLFNSSVETRTEGAPVFTIEETAGCNCAQIIEHLGIGDGHTKFGCSTGVMRRWVRSVQAQ